MALYNAFTETVVSNAVAMGRLQIQESGLSEVNSWRGSPELPLVLEDQSEKLSFVPMSPNDGNVKDARNFEWDGQVLTGYTKNDSTEQRNVTSPMELNPEAKAFVLNSIELGKFPLKQDCSLSFETDSTSYAASI